MTIAPTLGLVGPAAPWAGGVARFTSDLAEQLRARGGLRWLSWRVPHRRTPPGTELDLTAAAEPLATPVLGLSTSPRGGLPDLFRPERRSASRRLELLRDGDALLLSVGRVSAEKRLDVLLAAIARLRAERPGCRLVLAGDGPARAELEGAAPEGVTFLGELHGPELAELYACADLFCFPSTTDTFGQVLLEAAASGLPAVAARAGRTLELVAHERTGLLVRPGDVDELAGALRLLVDDPGLRLRLGRAARSHALERTHERAHRELMDGWQLALAPVVRTPPAARRGAAA